MVESETGSRTVTISSVDGVHHAIHLLRQTYPFSDWRIINVASVADINDRTIKNAGGRLPKS